MKTTAIQKAIGAYAVSHPMKAHEAKQEMSVVLNRVRELEAFVHKFEDNFNTCQGCDGKGLLTDEIEFEFTCPDCDGTGILVASHGILKVELPDEARKLLKGNAPEGSESNPMNDMAALLISASAMLYRCKLIIESQSNVPHLIEGNIETLYWTIDETLEKHGFNQYQYISAKPSEEQS